ncbi:hypothetical protein BX62_25865 [Escherichia coli O121:H19 str. 2010C-4254]|nr:hypothetical protein BX62_25865 [Escherichia coli O121:H19 str. 2010C-4254]
MEPSLYVRSRPISTYPSCCAGTILPILASFIVFFPVESGMPIRCCSSGANTPESASRLSGVLSEAIALSGLSSKIFCRLFTACPAFAA